MCAATQFKLQATSNNTARKMLPRREELDTHLFVYFLADLDTYVMHAQFAGTDFPVSRFTTRKRSF